MERLFGESMLCVREAMRAGRNSTPHETASGKRTHVTPLYQNLSHPQLISVKKTVQKLLLRSNESRGLVAFVWLVVCMHAYCPLTLRHNNCINHLLIRWSAVEVDRNVAVEGCLSETTKPTVSKRAWRGLLNEADDAAPLAARRLPTGCPWQAKSLPL